MRRRKILQATGAVAVVVVGGAVWRAYQQRVWSPGAGPAYEPWHNWEAASTAGPLALVRAAILASSPHNTQPWLFRVTDQQIELYADTPRNLGTFDPYLREMHLGLGCALENIALAARAHGLRADIQLADGRLDKIAATPPRPLVARIALAPGPTERSPLYEAIAQRHTNRGAYDPARAPAPAALDALRALTEGDADVQVRLLTTAAERAQCADAIVRATEQIVADRTMVLDSDKWFRHSWAELQQHRDGITLDASGLPPVLTVVAKMMPPAPADTSHGYWLDATRSVHVAAPAFGFITVRDLYDRAQTLRAGRLWQRIHLWGTTQGLAMQPLNQPIEMVDRERDLGRAAKAAATLAALLGGAERGGAEGGGADRKPTFAFRMGYALANAKASPRRAVEQVLVQA
jgi:hypothetical protein